jgi:hypothetical protein
MIQARIDNLPPVAQKTFSAQLQPFLGAFACQFEENCEGVEGLARLTVSVRIPPARTVSLVRLFRPGARIIPMAPAPAQP